MSFIFSLSSSLLFRDNNQTLPKKLSSFSYDYFVIKDNNEVP